MAYSVSPTGVELAGRSTGLPELLDHEVRRTAYCSRMCRERARTRIRQGRPTARAGRPPRGAVGERAFGSPEYLRATAAGMRKQAARLLHCLCCASLALERPDRLGG